MPLFGKGTASFRRLLALGPVPDEDTIRQALVDDQFRHFQDGLEEVRQGWCDWRNPLLVPAEDTMPLLFSDCAFLGFRIDTRKVPASTLKAHVDLKISKLTSDTGAAFIGKDVRKTLTDEVKTELLRKQPPVTKLIEVAWHLPTGIVLIGSTSKSVVEDVCSLMIKSFGVELHALAPMLAVGHAAKDLSTDDVTALEPIALCESEVEGNMADINRGFLGQEFAMWLWLRCTTEGGRSTDGDDDTALFFEDSIQLAAQHGAAKNVTLKKGHPSESEAAFKALTEGMKPTKLKLKLMSGELEWVFGLNAETFDISSMKLPAFKAGNSNEYAGFRMELINDALGMFDKRFGQFMHERMDKDAITESMTAWATAGLATAATYTEDDGGEGDGE